MDESGELRRLLSLELHSLCLSLNLVRVLKSGRLRWAGRNAFKYLICKPLGKIPLGRLKHRLKDNIRIDLQEIGVSTRNWIDSVQDRDLKSLNL